MDELKCAKCVKTFSTEKSCLKHKQKCIKKGFDCNLCNKHFISNYHFEKHLKKHENTKDIYIKPEELNATSFNLRQCKFCSAIFQTGQEYLSHIETVHKEFPKTHFMCSECGKQYRCKTDLNLHIKSKCGTEKLFKCKLCSKELKSAGSLYTHMIRHDGTKSFMCRFCAKQFFTRGQLQVHERIHTQEKAYICEVCNKGFCHRESLITHSSLHTGIKPYQCENCGNSFSCVGNLIKHRRTHADTCGLIPSNSHRMKNPSTKIKVRINTPANVKLKAIQKNKALEEELDFIKTELALTEMNESQISSNSKLPESFIINSNEESQSSICSDTVFAEFTQSDDENEDSEDTTPLASLISRNQDENTFSSNCDNFIKKIEPEIEIEKEKNIAEKAKKENIQNHGCNKIKKRRRRKADRSREKSLKKFQSEVNFDNNGYADCKYCGKRYTNIRWMYRHISEHEKNLKVTGIDPNCRELPTHKCSCCKLTFFTKEEATTHQQNIHADRLTCFECNKIFANRDCLRTHNNIRHKGIARKDYLYVCEKCGKQFKQRSYLNTHESKNCKDGPYFPCAICNKHFSSKYTRKNHMHVHNSEKKFMCNFCPKSFHWKGQLKIHERGHTGEKPFVCLFCPKAFAYKESLLTHNTLHTGIKPYLCKGCGSRFSCIGNLIKHRKTHASKGCGEWVYTTHKPPEETMVS